MAKVFKITEIVMRNGNVYTVGARPTHFGQGEAIVESITCNRSDNAFNKGLQMPGESYTIQIENERRLIPMREVVDLGGMWTEKAKSGEEVPELPEV